MKRYTFTLLLVLCAAVLYAQQDTVRVGDQWGLLELNPRYKRMNVKMVEDIKRDTTATWKRRLMVQTNVIDWALTVPNLTVGIDLGDPFVRTTPTLLIGMRNTFGGYRFNDQRNSYDYQGVKVELRRHWVPKKYMKNIVADEPPKAPGRFYGGIFGEYSWANHLDGSRFDASKYKKQDMWVPYGPAYIAGVSWGYELRKQNYNHRLHFNWDFGVDAGLVYAPKMDRNFTPLVTDLRVALNFRHDRINFLYWKPSHRQFDRNANYNRELQLQLARCRQQIDSMGPMVIHVTSLTGDSAFKEVITEEQVIKQVQKHFDFKGLKYGTLTHYETSTPFPIQGKELGEYYAIDYRFGMRAENKLEEQYGTDTIAFSFPFAVRLYGYEDADSLLQRFERNVRKWRDDNGGNYPTLKLPHLDREHVAGHATLAQIIGLFKEITGIELQREQITGIYYKGETPGSASLPVKEEEVNLRVKRNCYYSIGVKLHPQCELLDGAMATRFVLDFDNAEQMQREYALLARYFNSGRKLNLERVWTGEELVPVTAEEIVDAIARDTHDSINFLRPAMIELVDSANTLGVHRFSITYDKLFAKIADRRYQITDSLGRRQAEELHKLINDRGYIGYYRDFNYVGYPTLRVDNASDPSQVTAEAVAAAMSDYYGITIRAHQIAQPVYVDGNGNAVYTQAWAEHPEVYRGMALVKLHPEHGNQVKFYYKVQKK